jgi:hypothetical protein
MLCEIGLLDPKIQLFLSFSFEISGTGGFLSLITKMKFEMKMEKRTLSCLILHVAQRSVIIAT